MILAGRQVKSSRVTSTGHHRLYGWIRLTGKGLLLPSVTV
jgi:hypothetical protein